MEETNISYAYTRYVDGEFLIIVGREVSVNTMVSRVEGGHLAIISCGVTAGRTN